MMGKISLLTYYWFNDFTVGIIYTFCNYFIDYVEHAEIDTAPNSESAINQSSERSPPQTCRLEVGINTTWSDTANTNFSLKTESKLQHPNPNSLCLTFNQKLPSVSSCQPNFHSLMYDEKNVFNSVTNQ